MNAKPIIVLQDVFLNQVRKDRTPVEINLMDGNSYRGFVKGFDLYTVIMECENRKQLMVYKHAISSVSPDKPVSFIPPDKGERKPQ